MTQQSRPAGLAVEGGIPVRSEFLVFGAPAIEEPEIAEVVDTLRSGWLGTGPKVRRFEEDFKAYTGARHAVALNSCTAGLELALDVAGVGPGHEVITTPLTFAATANVIIHRGARPVFVDVDRETMNIDVARIEGAISQRTRAIIPVDMAGRPCAIAEIMEIARRRNLIVIQDAAHAVEARYRELRVGSVASMTVFSFYVTKNVCTVEGGMVTTDNDDWADQMRIKSLHGISRDAWKRYSSDGYQPYETLYPGYKFNMMDIQAALGIHQLARVERNLEVRERLWRKYDGAFAELDEILTPSNDLPSGSRHARHLYTILLDLDRLSISRNRFIELMKAENIGTGVHFTALHLHRFYRETFGFKVGDFPNAEWIGDRTVSLPLSAKLSDDDVASVVEAVRKICFASHRTAQRSRAL